MNHTQPPAEAIAVEDASITIAAPPEAVYALVADVTRMGEWSPECVGGRWLEGPDGRPGTGQEGDWFEGDNQVGEREWSRECQVAVADPGHEFTFVVGGVEADRTWWSYQLTADGHGTELTERWWVVNKSPALADMSDEQFQGRVTKTREMLGLTLAALKAAAEA